MAVYYMCMNMAWCNSQNSKQRLDWRQWKYLSMVLEGQ